MKEDISEYSKGDKHKMQRKIWINVIGMILLALVTIFYFTYTNSEERSSEGKVFCILFPLLFGILIILRLKKLVTFLKRNRKIEVTGTVTNKEAHIRRGRNSTSHFYIELDKQKAYSFTNERLFDSLQTGMLVRLTFLEDNVTFTDLEVLSNDGEKIQAAGPSTIPLPPAIIKKGFNEAEKLILRNARSRHIKRKLIFIIFFGAMEIPGLLLIMASPEILNLIVVGILLIPYFLYLYFISHRFSKDLRKQDKICKYSTITDKLESDRLLINNEPEEFSKNNFFYVRCREGLFNISEDFYLQCDAGKNIYLETARYSGILLHINHKG